MSFAIEVPGEASPLSAQELSRTLQLATSSHDQSQRQAAGQQLATWEAHGDYYPFLQSAFLDKSLPHEIRLLAIIQLKNGIDRYWRHRTLSNAIQPDKKEVIRSNLFRGSVGEDDKQLAFHNALVIAKIIRIDFPREWPDAMTSLVALLRETKDGDQTHLSGALLILLRVVKELGTARLRQSQTSLQRSTPELVYLLGEIYTASTASWTSFLNGEGNQHVAEVSMQNSLTAFKALRRLLIVGYEYPHQDTTVSKAWDLSQTHFGQFLGFINQNSQVSMPYSDLIAKHLLQFSKLHLEMADTHPTSFAALPNSYPLVRAYWDLVAKFAEVFDKSSGLRQGSSAMDGTDNKANPEGPLSEKLALKGLLLVRTCLRMVTQPQHTFKYRTPAMKEEREQRLLHLKNVLLKDDFIAEMANVIVSKLLIFRQADLEAWEEEPEEWEQQEEAQGSAWEWEVRPCAENVLHTLLIGFKHLLIQPLLAYFETVKDPNVGVMKKESVYTALGLAAEHIFKTFDFDDFLRTVLVKDLQLHDPLCRILRRRIGILLSQWVPISVSPGSRPLIYEIYRHLLNASDSNNDLVVRISAARQLKIVVDDFDFDADGFRPYAESILTELIQLLRQAEVDETKLAILNTTRVVIERMESHVNDFGDLIMSALPDIWESAGQLGFMLKQAVLMILQALVMSMKAQSSRYHSIILPLISQAVDEGSEVYVYLIEEALELWVNVLSRSEPPLSPEVLSLIEPAIKQLEAQTEQQLTILSITGSYILLAPEVMLSDRFRQPLIKALGDTYQTKARDQLAVATKYTEVIIRYAEELGQVDGLKAVVRDMMATGFLPLILTNIHDAYTAHQTSGPNRKEPKVGNVTLTDYFHILARIALADPGTFVETLASLGSPLNEVWEWLSAEWFANFDCIADDTLKKLGLLALTRLMELGQPMHELVLAKLQDYFLMWSIVISSIYDEQDPSMDQVVLTAELETTPWDTAKDIRERALIVNDPVRRVDSLTFVKKVLGGLVERTGGEQAFKDNYLCNVDTDVVSGFYSLSQKVGSGT